MTYNDLEKERAQIIKTVLEMGHIPVGMEMFSAADEGQWQVIARTIEQSDYYVVIVAHRYGSTVGGVSFTEKEYEFAIEKGIPILGFLIEEGASWPADRFDKNGTLLKKLSRFKEKVRAKPVSFWSDANDLRGKCAVAITKQIAVLPRPGWVRSTETAGADVLPEVVRLSKENAELRNHLQQLQSSHEGGRAAELRDIWTVMRKSELNVPLVVRRLSQLEFFRVMAVSIHKAASRWRASESIVSTLHESDLLPKTEHSEREATQQLSSQLNSLVMPFLEFGLVERDYANESTMGGIRMRHSEETYSISSKGRDFLAMVSLKERLVEEPSGESEDSDEEHDPDSQH